MNTPSTRKTQKRTTKRRRDILNASLRCFLRHGVEASTIEQIRDASGASAGSIYHHFGSKQAIAVALYVEGMRDLARAMSEAMNRHTPLADGLEALIGAYFHWVGKNRDWALYLLRVATADLSTSESEQIDQVNAQARKDLGEWLKPFVESGEIRHFPEEIYASLVYGPGTHFVRHALSGRIDLDFHVAVKILSEAAYHSLVTGKRETVTGKRETPSRKPSEWMIH